MSVDIPTPPTPPSAASPGTFQARADAFLAWWAALAADMDGQGPMLGMSDILGTVSQSGGTPTGALFETGSNANGRYWRHASGLQICTHFLTLTHATAQYVNGEWNYPASFAETPRVTASLDRISLTENADPDDDEVTAPYFGVVNSTNANVRVSRIKGLTNFASGNSCGIYIQATGRWF